MSTKSRLRKWFPLVILGLALTIIILDTTILNVSLRAIITDLKTDIQSFQWVITAYPLMLAAFTITGGLLGDLFGRKKMFIAGAVIFAIGSFITSISRGVGVTIPAPIAQEISSISQQATVAANRDTLFMSVFFIVAALLLSIKLPNGTNIEKAQSVAVGH